MVAYIRRGKIMNERKRKNFKRLGCLAASLVMVISMLPMASIKSYADGKPVVTITDTFPPTLDMDEEMWGFSISPSGYSVANDDDGIVDTSKKISFSWLIEDSEGFDIMGKNYNFASYPAVGTRYYAWANITADDDKACDIDLVINGTTYNCVPKGTKGMHTIIDVGILDASGNFSSGSPDPKPDPTPSPSPSSKSEPAKPAEPAKTDLEIREALEMELPVATVTVDMTQFNKSDSAVVPGTTYNLSNFVTTAGIVKGINTAVVASNKNGSDTVTIYSGKPLCFNNAIVKAIQNGKKTVVYYFTYKGHLYSVTVPATVDATKVLEKAGFAGPFYVGAQLGTTRLIK